MDADHNSRYEFLDWLRVIAIFVLLFFHTGMLFVGWGWHITNAETIPGLQLPMDIAHRLRMPLLFLIAGAGMWFALRRAAAAVCSASARCACWCRRSSACFSSSRRRSTSSASSHGDWHGGYLSFFIERVFQFEPYPAGDFSWHHLWFIVYLYVYVLLLMPLLLWWRSRQDRREARRVDFRARAAAGAERGPAQAAVSRSRTTWSATGTSSITICC